MKMKHVRADDPVDTAEELIHLRATERDKVAKTNQFFDRYGKLILAVLVAISGWIMKDIVQPLRAIPAVIENQARTDSVLKVINLKMDTADSDRKQMVRWLSKLTSLQCLAMTARERRLADFSCDN